MKLSDLLQSPPKIHEWGKRGILTSSGMPQQVFEFMDSILTSKSVTLETGMGISTSVFAFKNTYHTCIAPDSNEANRLKEYLSSLKISDEKIDFISKKSSEVWNNYISHQTDLVLIDGSHGFPAPFMDWYFLTQGLKINGYLVIDDVHIYTGKLLMDFLMHEKEWRHIKTYSHKTALFQKIGSFDYDKEFIHQPFVLKQSKALQNSLKIKLKFKGLFDKLKRLFKKN